MYRLLQEADRVLEWRDQPKHPQYSKPELLTQKTNEILSLDITELHGLTKYMLEYLNVILDFYSLYLTGLLFAEAQNYDLAHTSFV